VIRALTVALTFALAACAAAPPPIHLTEEWPSQPGDYDTVTQSWTRSATLHAEYQEVFTLAATFKSPAWRAAHAQRDAEHRGLAGGERDQRLAQAQAEVAGPYEVELLLTTYERRENDLDKGKKSVWRVVLVDDAGKEIEPLEIVRDKRPGPTVHAEFPAFGDFTTPYIARFPRTSPVLGANVKQLRLRMSGERGSVELAWQAAT